MSNTYNYANRYGGDKSDAEVALDFQRRQASALERIADALERMAGPVKDIEYKNHE